MGSTRNERLSTTGQTGTPPPPPSRLILFWKTFRKNSLAVSGLTIFLLFFFVALAGLVLTSGSDPRLDPAQIRLEEKLLPPLTEADTEALTKAEQPFLNLYLFGTDDLGRDVFARMLQGAWVSLTVGFVAVGIAILIGIVLGGLAGYFGTVTISLSSCLGVLLLAAVAPVLVFNHGAAGLLAGLAGLVLVLLPFGHRLWLRARTGSAKHWTPALGISVDTLIMRFVDIMLCFPSFFLILTVIALLPPSIYNIMVVIGLTSWMGAARFVRAEFLSLREQDFVTAAKALGVSKTRIIFQHMLPNAVAPVLVSATIGIATAILTEAGLSFLGFGVPPPQATWGNILSEGKRFIFDAPWLTLIPGLAILIVVLAFNLFGEGLREALNPRLRNL